MDNMIEEAAALADLGGQSEPSPRVRELLRYHETGGHGGCGDATLDEAHQALAIQATEVEQLRAQVERARGLIAELAVRVERFQRAMNTGDWFDPELDGAEGRPVSVLATVADPAKRTFKPPSLKKDDLLDRARTYLTGETKPLSSLSPDEGGGEE